MPTLRDSIFDLANAFAQNLVSTLRRGAVEQLLAGLEHPAHARPAGLPEPGKQPRAKRTRAARNPSKGNPANVTIVIEQIVAVLQKHPAGLRAEVLRTELGLEPKELAGPIASALSSKQIGKRGANRGTVYFLSSTSARDEARDASAPAAREERTPAPAAPKPSPAKTGKKRRGAYVVVVGDVSKAAERGETPAASAPAEE